MILNGNPMNNPNGSNDYNNGGFVTWKDQDDLNRAVSSSLTRIFVRMFFALVVTTLAALATIASPAMQQLIFGNPFGVIVVVVAQLALVIAISRAMNRLSAAAANGLFFLYAALNGVMFSSIFLYYSLGTIYLAFGVTALTFGAMAIYGVVTKADLTKMGQFAIMGVIGIIIASIVNMFLRSSGFDLLISYVAVILFIILTAYDTQKIRNMLVTAKTANQEEAVKKISVMGALMLYLDFINLFLRILRIMGRRR